jgi:hypothetical protein
MPSPARPLWLSCLTRRRSVRLGDAPRADRFPGSAARLEFALHMRILWSGQRQEMTASDS